MRTREENVIHMENMGYTGISPDQFYNSAMASVQYVRSHYSGNTAYYIGKEGMKQALLDEGFTISDQNPDFVFVGLNKDADYAQYSKALQLLLNGAKLIGTNQDRILAKPGGFEMGNGSIVAMFEYASSQKSPNIAKPHTPILELCLSHFHLKNGRCDFGSETIWKRIFLLGKNCACADDLCTDGCSYTKDVERLNIHPDIIVRDLLDCLDFSFDSFMLYGF